MDVDPLAAGGGEFDGAAVPERQPVGGEEPEAPGVGVADEQPPRGRALVVAEQVERRADAVGRAVEEALIAVARGGWIGTATVAAGAGISSTDVTSGSAAG